MIRDEEQIKSFIEETLDSMKEEAPNLIEYVQVAQAPKSSLMPFKIIVGSTHVEKKKRIAKTKARIAELEKMIPETEKALEMIEKNKKGVMDKKSRDFAMTAYDRTRTNLAEYKSELFKLQKQLREDTAK